MLHKWTVKRQNFVFQEMNSFREQSIFSHVRKLSLKFESLMNICYSWKCWERYERNTKNDEKSNKPKEITTFFLKKKVQSWKEMCRALYNLPPSNQNLTMKSA